MRPTRIWKWPRILLWKQGSPSCPNTSMKYRHQSTIRLYEKIALRLPYPKHPNFPLWLARFLRTRQNEKILKKSNRILASKLKLVSVILYSLGKLERMKKSQPLKAIISNGTLFLWISWILSTFWSKIVVTCGILTNNAHSSFSIIPLSMQQYQCEKLQIPLLVLFNYAFQQRLSSSASHSNSDWIWYPEDKSWNWNATKDEIWMKT